MSLEHAMLGFLQHKPISGYDMKKMFDASVRHFWSADQSQIYRTLNKLTEAGFITMELVVHDTKPNSKVYHITEAGRAEFLNWLNEPVSMVERRIPWLIQVFFAAKLPDDEIISIFKHIEVQIREKIEECKICRTLGSLSDEAAFTERDVFFHELTYDYGLMLYDSILRWLEKTIEQIERKEHPAISGNEEQGSVQS